MIVFWFLVKEGIRNLFRSGYAGAFSILVIAISIVIVGFGYIFARDTLIFVENIKSQFDVDVFLFSTAPQQEIDKLKEEIKTFPEVEKVVFISSDSAAKKFKSEFGEDIFQILDYNPLPPSLSISFKKGYRNLQTIEMMSSVLKNSPIVDEIKYRKTFIELIEKYQRYLIVAVIVIFAFLTLISVILASNSIKMSIFARHELIETMKLLGATNNFIRAPFLIEGGLEGMCGALIAIIFILSFAYGINKYIFPIIGYKILVSYRFYIGLLLVGGFLGVVGSLRAVHKFL